MQSDCCWYGLPTFANSVAIGKVAPKPDLYTAPEERARFELCGDSAPAKRSAGRHAHPGERSASSTAAFPRKVDRFLQHFAILYSRKASRRALYDYTSSQDSEKDSTCGT